MSRQPPRIPSPTEDQCDLQGTLPMVAASPITPTFPSPITPTVPFVLAGTPDTNRPERLTAGLEQDAPGAIAAECRAEVQRGEPRLHRPLHERDSLTPAKQEELPHDTAHLLKVTVDSPGAGSPHACGSTSHPTAARSAQLQADASDPSPSAVKRRRSSASSSDTSAPMAQSPFRIARRITTDLCDDRMHKPVRLALPGVAGSATQVHAGNEPQDVPMTLEPVCVFAPESSGPAPPNTPHELARLHVAICGGLNAGAMAIELAGSKCQSMTYIDSSPRGQRLAREKWPGVIIYNDMGSFIDNIKDWWAEASATFPSIWLDTQAGTPCQGHLRPAGQHNLGWLDTRSVCVLQLFRLQFELSKCLRPGDSQTMLLEMVSAASRDPADIRLWSGLFRHPIFLFKRTGWHNRRRIWMLNIPPNMTDIAWTTVKKRLADVFDFETWEMPWLFTEGNGLFPSLLRPVPTEMPEGSPITTTQSNAWHRSALIWRRDDGCEVRARRLQNYDVDIHQLGPRRAWDDSGLFRFRAAWGQTPMLQYLCRPPNAWEQGLLYGYPRHYFQTVDNWLTPDMILDMLAEGWCLDVPIAVEHIFRDPRISSRCLRLQLASPAEAVIGVTIYAHCTGRQQLIIHPPPAIQENLSYIPPVDVVIQQQKCPVCGVIMHAETNLVELSLRCSCQCGVCYDVPAEIVSCRGDTISVRPFHPPPVEEQSQRRPSPSDRER